MIFANWKLNPKTKEDAVKMARYSDYNGVVVCPPFIYIQTVKNTLSNADIGAQNCYLKKEGAYTGEVSADMLKDMGCSYVILGHSERREYFNETSSFVNQKIKYAIDQNLIPVVCIGDKEKEDSIGQIEKQIKGTLDNVLLSKVIIAYEPVFAIGSGKPCDTEEAEKKKVFIKSILAKNYQKGEIVPILYGGSVNAKNGADYIKKAGFDGLLVGGASIKPKEFELLIKNVFKKI